MYGMCKQHFKKEKTLCEVLLEFAEDHHDDGKVVVMLNGHLYILFIINYLVANEEEYFCKKKERKKHKLLQKLSLLEPLCQVGLWKSWLRIINFHLVSVELVDMIFGYSRKILLILYTFF